MPTRGRVKPGADRGWDVGGVGVREASPSGPSPPTPTLGQALGAAYGSALTMFPHCPGFGGTESSGGPRLPAVLPPHRGPGGVRDQSPAVAALSLPGVPAPPTGSAQEPRGHAETLARTQGYPRGTWPARRGPGRGVGADRV